ncbi:MAG: hypothetical protein GF353_28245 [Candidatus Lokiarchaeota archaeon]|nr:hypothetical protein [Candidatus Lokiarchaeota archaeon]
MELLLTSFGLSHIYPYEDNTNFDLFYRMPPIKMTKVGKNFLMDFSVLLLCDRLIIDQITFDKIINNKVHWAYKSVAETLHLLSNEGFLRIEDFTSILHANRSLLDKMLEKDLENIEHWFSIFKSSNEIWNAFVTSMVGHIRNEISLKDELDKLLDIPPFQRGFKKEYSLETKNSLSNFHVRNHILSVFFENFIRNYHNHNPMSNQKNGINHIFKDEIRNYLAYINSNLVLSHYFNSGFYDWDDFSPFYKDKFLTIGKEEFPNEREIKNLRQLFDISFPDYSIQNPKEFIKLLRDKRIDDIRKLVHGSVEDDITFDIDFARKTLQEVLNIERTLSKRRNIVSYITMPLGFIPMVGTPIQKAVEESILVPTELKKRKKFRWFYLISNIKKK